MRTEEINRSTLKRIVFKHRFILRPYQYQNADAKGYNCQTINRRDKNNLGNDY